MWVGLFFYFIFVTVTLNVSLFLILVIGSNITFNNWKIRVKIIWYISFFDMIIFYQIVGIAIISEP